MRAGIIVLSQDPSLRDAVAGVATFAAGDAELVEAALAAEPPIVVVDLDHAAADTALRRLATLPTAPFVVAIAPGAAGCDSYLAVPLATAQGTPGFVGLVTSGVRVFTAEDRAVLGATTSRLETELGWRAVHEHTADELDRLVNGPGLDPLLNV